MYFMFIFGCIPEMSFLSGYIQYTSNTSKFSSSNSPQQISLRWNKKKTKQTNNFIVKKGIKKKKFITFSILECATFRTLITALQFCPLICSIIKFNLADMYFQFSSSISGPESLASLLSCLLSVRTCNPIGEKKKSNAYYS